MTKVVHAEVEILYATTYQAACGAKTGDLSSYDPHVTCTKCLKKLGYDAK